MAPLESESDVNRVVAYPVPWRWAAALLFGLSRASLLFILALAIFMTDPPITPPVLARVVVLLAVLPGLAAWLIERAFTGTFTLHDATLVVQRHDLRVEIPCASIVRVSAWTLPLPAPGVTVYLRSGRCFRCSSRGVQTFVATLAAAGVSAARTVAAHPSLVYSAARAPRPRWPQQLGKFAGFALLPASVLFYTHQHIAYGGLLGEYYMYGPAAYLATFAIHWGTLTVYLVLYAAVWRAMAEAGVLLVAWIAAAHALRVRRIVEVVCTVGYYAGVPVMLGLRYLS